MTIPTERRRRLRLPKPQPYDKQVEGARALTKELTDSLVTHFTGPYMDRAHRLDHELGDKTSPTGDTDYTRAVSEAGSVALVLRERFEEVVKSFNDHVARFEGAVSSKDGDIRAARQSLIESVNTTGAQLRREFGNITKHDSLMQDMEAAKVDELVNEAKHRVAKWSEEIIKITHTWHALRH